jgi:hypothetical protein
MVVEPSLAAYEEIVRPLPETENYNLEWAEQAYLTSAIDSATFVSKSCISRSQTLEVRPHGIRSVRDR